MYLHQDKENFEQIILKINSETGIESGIIEKDYYVSLILQNLFDMVPNLIFKGGTSLSKCYKIIDRFSGDIDLTMIPEKITQGERVKVNRAIKGVCAKYDLTIANEEKIKSNLQYNNYKIEYSPIFKQQGLKPGVQIDTVFSIRSFPYEQKPAISMIGEYLLNNGFSEIASQYEIREFNVNVQSLERTYLDKIFAICDYYLTEKTSERSRHIYDIYKIYPKIEHNDELKRLFIDTKNERAQSRFCESAKSDKTITQLLNEIISKEYFKSDFNSITEKLLFENVSYDQAIGTLKEICDSGFFD